jgi:hypothetical protein
MTGSLFRTELRHALVSLAAKERMTMLTDFNAKKVVQRKTRWCSLSTNALPPDNRTVAETIKNLQ